MKKLLITGGAGFIGSNFVRHILDTTNSRMIVNVDALTYAGNPLNFSDFSQEMKERYRFVHGDIRDPAILKKIFDEEDFDGVVHFAAESHVDRSILGPAAFIETNISGTFNLLESSLKYWNGKGRPDGFRFIHISTDEVYGSLGPEGYFTEKTPYDPSSPYSASKAASDHLVKAYFHTYGFPAIITNCSNNYGPYQFPEKLIPLIVLNVLENKPLPVYGDGKNVRDWLYVIDHCEAIFKVLADGIIGETYNIGGNSEFQNIEIVHLLCDMVDKKLDRGTKNGSRKLIAFVKDRPGHDRRYAIDASKIKNELGWSPRFRFEEAIEETVNWYLENMDWVNGVRSGKYLEWIERNYGKRV
ncbi:MAG: dTDP-glucose 4,6-dehydratase [Desulfobacterales bacterium]|nr:dTDP-glucose 4,6-dehydratase [Desulfobacterales bacterium]